LGDNTIIVILGPTAVGKTAASISMARSIGTQIISFDSRQCYRELNIGVAKPAPEELSAVRHYFISSHSIREEVNAALFADLARGWAADIFRQSPAAVMVGGTGLYLRAFLEGLDEIPPVDPAIRRRLREDYECNGLAWLQEELRSKDPAFYAAGERLNPQRLLRALEVRLSTGRSILDFRRGAPRKLPFAVRKIGLELPKEELHRRIQDRVDQMLSQGLVDEVRALVPYRNHNALQTVGYKEIFAYLDGQCSLDEAVARIKTNTRQYAKRQLTWFRRDPAITWTHPEKFPYL